jgi:FixJ family two-component response regulator
MRSKTTIYLCDDEDDVRGGLSFLLHQYDFDVRAFASGQELLDAIEAEPKPLRAIFVLDQYNPPMNGDVLHDHLITLGYTKRCPVIFLSGHGTIPRAVSAINKGALSYVEKPYTKDALFPLLDRALELEEQWHAQAKRSDFLRYMWNSLTAAQREVVVMSAEGESNRIIAAKLGIGERAVEERKAKAYEKLGVDTVATLATTIAAMKACGIYTEIEGKE